MERDQINCSLKKCIKVISVRFIDRNLLKNVTNGVNLVRIGHFLLKCQTFGDFGGQTEIICQNLGQVFK